MCGMFRRFHLLEPQVLATLGLGLTKYSRQLPKHVLRLAWAQGKFVDFGMRLKDTLCYVDL